jgi:hypothetical protein
VGRTYGMNVCSEKVGSLLSWNAKPDLGQRFAEHLEQILVLGVTATQQLNAYVVFSIWLE